MKEREWETHYLPDIEFFVRTRQAEVDCIAEVEAFEGIAWPVGSDWPEDVPNQVYIRGWNDGGDMVEVDRLDEAHRALHGTIKWDGCADLTWGDGDDNGYAHYCAMKNAVKVGTLMEHVYRIAWEFHLNRNPDEAAWRWELYAGE